jgi:hypothetical protein
VGREGWGELKKGRVGAWKFGGVGLGTSGTIFGKRIEFPIVGAI